MEEIEQAINLLEAIFDLIEAIDRQVKRDAQRMEWQSHTIRELARYLSENGVAISRFTTTTQETLVAVALNGDY